jgi:hypothetical protein
MSESTAGERVQPWSLTEMERNRETERGASKWTEDKIMKEDEKEKDKIT